ncbi:MAG: hypothetical protein QOI12_2766 [Alphaproteobacteria bacterium]|jgi:SAM-dependent methyltransferase|nr:hypothetical protein [Alphaproteobacteria bacterium]
MSAINPAVHPLIALAQLYQAYLERPTVQDISDHDDMFVKGLEGGRQHYFNVGRSAIDMIIGALLLGKKSVVGSILDLPCGGGRVTRHLQSLFPDAELYVSDLDRQKEAFVIARFEALGIRPNPHFELAPERTFDLIFVGSLVTHFDEASFRRAVDWFLASLSTDGVLVMTTHGRRHDRQQSHGQWIEPELWAPARRDFQAKGFGYADYPFLPGYGLSACSPSWLMKLVETKNDVRVLSFQEFAWDDHQDVIVMQRRAV